MPELPEVEVTRRGIEPYILGQTLINTQIRIAKLRWPISAQIVTLAQQKIKKVMRRAKYLILECELGFLLIHLGMSGTLRILSNTQASPKAEKHEHFDLIFKNHIVRYRDPRRFGALLWHAHSDGPIETHSLLSKLGKEPFDPLLTATCLHQQLRNKVRSIKHVLLSGTVVAGIGNIYACESLFWARILPQTAANTLSLTACDALVLAIRSILTQAIQQGGSTLRDFVASDGASGHFQQTHAVYQRSGLPCIICQQPIANIKQNQRSSFYCLHCQNLS